MFSIYVGIQSDSREPKFKKCYGEEITASHFTCSSRKITALRLRTLFFGGFLMHPLIRVI